jgi:hypothetical protein
VWVAWLTHPVATTIPFGMIPIGVEALILGDHASKAFGNFGGATLVRVLGVALLLGGLIVVTGIVREDPALEPIGLTFVALGATIYGGGVIAGLGPQGLIAGQLALGIAVGFLGRILRLVRDAPSSD